MSKADDILKKYGITQVRGSERSASSSTSNTSTQNAKSTGNTKADSILAKYGITQVRGSEGGSTVSLSGAGGSAQSWIESSKSYLDDAEKYLGTWRKRDENDQEYASLMKRSSSLIADAYNWRNQYAGDDEAVSYIDEVISALSNSRGSFKKYLDYYGQWETEDKYNEYLANQKDYEEKSNYDIDAGQKEIEALEAELQKLKRTNPTPSAYLTGNTTVNGRPYAAGLQAQNEVSPTDSKIGELEKLISQKKQYLNQAKHIQEGITLSGVVDSADFDEYSGYVSTKSDSKWDKLIGKEYDETYEYINNQNGIRDEIKQKHRSYSSDNHFDDGESRFEENGYDHMTENEIAIYNYYYAKDGKDAAEKYLKNIQETLNYRKATAMYEDLEGKTAQELIFGVSVGLDQFASNAKNLFNTEDDYIAQTAYQMASGMVREDLADNGAKLPEWLGGASLGQVGYDAITTTANMAPSMLSSIAMNMIAPGSGAFVGNAMMFASSAGGAYQEALNLGYDKGSARAYSTLVGASEAGLQYLMGGISSLGGEVSGSMLNKMLNGIDNAFARTALKIGGNMFSEGLEEGLQEVLTPLFKNWTLMADEDINWSEVAYSGLLGALTAGFMEGPSTVFGEVNTYQTGRQLQKADISAQRLSDIGKTFSADTVAYQLAGRVNENTGAYTMGRLFNEIGATLTEQNVNEITEALVAKGMDQATAKKNAQALAYVVEGGQLTEKQVAVIEANEVLAEAARTTLIDGNTTWNQRAKGYNEALMALAQETVSPKASQTKTAEAGKENTPASDKVDTQKENVSDGSSEVDTSPAKVGSITAIKNRMATIKLEDGSEVSARDADLSPEDGVRIETIAKIDGISAADANTILNTLRVSTGASAQMDSLGATEAYKYGYYGFSMDHMAKHGVFANSLTEDQRKTIYEVGQRARQQQIEKDTPKKADGTAKKTGIYFDAGNGNVVPYSESNMTLDKKQSAGVQAAMVLHKLGIGGDIYFFNSYVNDQGKRVYKDKNGVERPAPNGWYAKDGSIHIDLNAGNKGEGYVLFTLAHELTHFIEQWSPHKYKVLADFLVENYEKGQSMDKLVRAKQKKLSQSRGKKVSYKEAYSEVVADSMEAMLADGNVLDKLIELKTKDNALFTKMKQFFDNLVAKIRNVYKGLTPDSDEGKAVLEMTDSIEKIQQLFADALVEASENFQSAEKNTTNDGGGVMFMSRDIEDVTEDTVRKDLTEVFDGKNVSAKSYIPISKTTPFALRYITGYSEDRPIIVEKKKAYFDMREDGKFKEDNSHHYHGMGVDGFLDAMDILNDPEYAVLEEIRDDTVHYAFISTNENGEEICIAFQMEVYKHENTMNGYPKGFYNLDITEFIATDEWLEAHGVEPGMSYKDYLLTFAENSLVYDRSIHKEQLEKARETDVGSAGLAASHINNRAFENNVAQNEPTVNSKSAEEVGLAVDEKTESVVPEPLFSERTWTESDYVQERDKAAKEIAKAVGVSEKKAKDYIDSVNSIAKMIADDRTRLDYFSSPGRSSFVGNVEYGGSFDFSTLCKKRRLLTGTFTAIQKALPNTALTANEILDIRNRMKKAGLEVSCGLCYVEGSRANMGQFAKEFLKLYKQYYPDAWQPNMADVNTPDGIEWVRINHPEAYEQYEYFWNHYGTLKPGDKNLFASQQKPKLYQLHTEYKGEILEKFNDDDNVEDKNLNGGIRLQSFSDFEIVHLIDTMQIIMDMSRVGLAGQAYTKVPDFAWALGDTGLKINLSLIAKGVDENGKLIFDDVEGMPIETAVALRNRYSKNVGTILVAFNDEQLLAAMADDRVDFIIPFHRSQWKKSQYEAMGLPAKTKDYTYMQNEKFIKPQYHEYRGRMVKDKATNYMPNEYWDFSKSGKENAEAYLDMCARNNKRPKFYKLLQNNGDGSYFLKADGSTDGYWKLLIDFKMYDNDGNGSPQMPVKPEFNMTEANRMLNDYKGGHSNFPVAQGIVDGFVQEYKDSHEGVQFSDRDTESVSNRSLLANAFESVAQNDIERKRLQEYKGKISLIESEERKLNELNEQIKSLSFAKGPKDTKKIRELQFEARLTANRINTYDKQLLRLEASLPLQNVLQREKKMAYDRAKQKGDEALAAYRLKAEAKQSEIMRDYRETRAALRSQKSETATMEREFIRIAKAYEKLEAKSTAKAGKDEMSISTLKAALKEETQKHREDQKTWEAEFKRLLREYEAADRSIDRLEAKIERQKQMAEKKVDDRKRSALREKIKSFKGRLEKSLLAPTDRQYVPINLIRAMLEVCELVDTDSDTDLYKADGSINKAQEKRNRTKEKLQNLKDEYEKLRTHSDPIYAGEFDEMVYTYLTELRDKFSGKNLNEMSFDDLTEMYEILRGIEETLQDARKLIGWGDAENVYEAGDAIVAEQNEITKSRKGGKRNAAQKARDASLNLSLSPMRNVERMSGYHGSSSLLKLFKKFEQGIRKKNKFVMEAYKSFESLTSDKKYDEAMYTEVGGKKYEDVNGRKFGISKMQMMQAILSYEREAANGMHHIEGSGFSFADLDMLRKGRLRDAISEEYSHRVPAAVNLVAEFTEALKGDQWCQDYMKAARKFFNSTAKDAINETSIALKHRIIAKDKSYIPFEVDKNFVVREISAENDIQQTINSYGMLKDTKKGASQPLIITGLNNILDRHIDQVGNVYGLAIEVRNFNKVWNVRSLDAVGNDPTVKAAIQRNWGVEGVKHIEQAVQDIQAPRHSEQSALYKKIKSGYIGATFLLNLSVVTKQIGSLYSATSMLKWRGPVRMVGNLLYTMVNHKNISAEVDKYTATAWMRRQGLSDSELHTFMTEGKKSFVGKLVGKLPAVFNPGKWITAMDTAVALSLWRYAKIDTAKRTGLKGEELLKATAEFYDDVVENTQSMTDALHRPEIQKRSDIVSESLGMFKTDLYQMAGQLQVTAGRFTANMTKENGMALGRTVYAVAMSAVWAQLMTTVFALLRYKVNHYRDDEDEELTAESWLKRQSFSLAGDLIGYIMPIFGSELVGTFETIMYGESENIMDNIVLDAVNDLYGTMVGIASSLKEGEMPKPEDMKKLVIKALQVFGVPANNIIRTYEAIRLHAIDIANGEFLSFEAGIDRSPKHHIHRIVEAVDAGKTSIAVGLYEEALEETAMDMADDGSFGKAELNKAKSSLQTALGDKYKDGEITEKQAVNVLIKAFGMDKDEAEQKVGEWTFKMEYGFAWSDRKTAYLDGAISARELKSALMDIGGTTAEEADEYIDELDWEAQGYDGATAAAVREYNENCASLNVPKDVYLHIRKFSNNTENDVDENGKTIYYSAMKKVMAEIGAQRLTADQKTAIARSLGWSESNIQKHKTW